jgi:hypothetical protein
MFDAKLIKKIYMKKKKNNDEKKKNDQNNSKIFVFQMFSLIYLRALIAFSSSPSSISKTFFPFFVSLNEKKNINQF